MSEKTYNLKSKLTLKEPLYLSISNTGIELTATPGREYGSSLLSAGAQPQTVFLERELELMEKTHDLTGYERVDSKLTRYQLESLIKTEDTRMYLVKDPTIKNIKLGDKLNGKYLEHQYLFTLEELSLITKQFGNLSLRGYKISAEDGDYSEYEEKLLKKDEYLSEEWSRAHTVSENVVLIRIFKLIAPAARFEISEEVLPYFKDSEGKSDYLKYIRREYWFEVYDYLYSVETSGLLTKEEVDYVKELRVTLQDIDDPDFSIIN